MTENGTRDSSEPGDPQTKPAPVDTGFDAAQILASVGEVAYDWHIGTDALLWSANAAAVLLISDLATISSGRGYARLLDAEHAQARHDVVMQSDKRDDGHGVA